MGGGTMQVGVSNFNNNYISSINGQMHPNYGSSNMGPMSSGSTQGYYASNIGNYPPKPMNSYPFPSMKSEPY